MTTICFCISCFPKAGTPLQKKTPWCRIQLKEDKKEDKNPPALLNDLPDDLLRHIRSLLRKMVKEERPYKLPFHYKLYGNFLSHNLKNMQWERQQEAIALTTKKGVLALDKKKHICHKQIWRCEECFAKTIETTLCWKCSDKFQKEEEYYFKSPLSTLLKH
tara:strand:- start:3118 stop:3600 length:483 start_codon:yes stop_codon:yes gene_type:complete